MELCRSQTISMSPIAHFCYEAVERISRQDPTLKMIDLSGDLCDDETFMNVIDCLLAYPDTIARLSLSENLLTDEVGIKLAQFVAISTTIQTIDLRYNRFGETTYMAMALALRTNTSLEDLYMNSDQMIDKSRVESTFMDTLMLNPHRPIRSYWDLYKSLSGDYSRLKKEAEKLGHPNMQALMATHFVRAF